jgi:hypothetical protein
MKQKMILWLFIALLSCGATFANNGKEPVESTGEQILQELKQIRILQDSVLFLQDSLQKARQIDVDSFRMRKHVNGLSEIGIMAQIEDNTNEKFLTGGLTLIAIISLIFGFFTFWYQQQTERHTKNVSVSSQLGVLKDLPRHFYRNLVCTVAMLFKYRHQDNKNTDDSYKAYPSEVNILKLQTLPEEFILSIDTSDDKIFDEMHEQKLLLKNYNLEVSIASNHFARKAIKEKSLMNDFDNLLFKPIFLISKLCNLYIMLAGKGWFSSKATPEDYVNESLCTFAMEHFAKWDFEKVKKGFQNELYKEIYSENSLVISSSIERSLNQLLKLVDNEKSLQFINVEETENGQKKYFINQGKFVSYFMKSKADVIEKNRKGRLVNEVLQSDDVDFLMETNDLTGKDYESAIRSYLEFWTKEEWEVKDWLYNMLKMDAVLELPIIGMIEH